MKNEHIIFTWNCLPNHRSFDFAYLPNFQTHNITHIYERLLEKGYTGKKTILKDHLKPLRPVRVKEGPSVRRYEIKPDKQAQMDWGICKYTDPSDQIRKVCVIPISSYVAVIVA